MPLIIIQTQSQHNLFLDMGLTFLQAFNCWVMLGRTRRRMCHLPRTLQCQAVRNAKPTSMRIAPVSIYRKLGSCLSAKNLPKYHSPYLLSYKSPKPGYVHFRTLYALHRHWYLIFYRPNSHKVVLMVQTLLFKASI